MRILTLVLIVSTVVAASDVPNAATLHRTKRGSANEVSTHLPTAHNANSSKILKDFALLRHNANELGQSIANLTNPTTKLSDSENLASTYAGVLDKRNFHKDKSQSTAVSEHNAHLDKETDMLDKLIETVSQSPQHHETNVHELKTRQASESHDNKEMARLLDDIDIDNYFEGPRGLADEEALLLSGGGPPLGGLSPLSALVGDRNPFGMCRMPRRNYKAQVYSITTGNTKNKYRNKEKSDASGNDALKYEIKIISKGDNLADGGDHNSHGSHVALNHDDDNGKKRYSIAGSDVAPGKHYKETEQVHSTNDDLKWKHSALKGNGVNINQMHTSKRAQNLQLPLEQQRQGEFSYMTQPLAALPSNNQFQQHVGIIVPVSVLPQHDAQPQRQQQTQLHMQQLKAQQQPQLQLQHVQQAQPAEQHSQRVQTQQEQHDQMQLKQLERQNIPFQPHAQAIHSIEVAKPSVPFPNYKPLEGFLKFANMLLYKVGTVVGVLSLFRNMPTEGMSFPLQHNDRIYKDFGKVWLANAPIGPNGPTSNLVYRRADNENQHVNPAAVVLNGPSEDENDAIDYFYSGMDAMAPQALASAPISAPVGTAIVRSAPGGTGLVPYGSASYLHAPYVLQQQPIASNEPAKPFNFIQNAIDMLLANDDETGDDDFELRCPVHYEKKSALQDGSVAGGSNDAQKDLIQVCSCRLYKKKKNTNDLGNGGSITINANPGHHMANAKTNNEFIY